MSRDAGRAAGRGAPRIRPVLAVLALSVAAAGQQEFDRLWEKARALASTRDPRAREAWAAALRAFLKMPPDSDGAVARLGRAGEAALGAGRPAMALELVAEAIARQGNTDAHLALQLRALLQLDDAEGFLAAAGGRFPGALGKALERENGAKQRLLGWADRWLRSARTEEALWLFDRLAAAGGPADRANLALALRHIGRDEESERAYRQALEAAPDDHLIWNDYGLYLNGVMRAAEAVAAFRQSYALEPEPGEGPAITNLLAMALFHPELVPDPPLDDLDRAFAVRARSPDPRVRESAMLRRVTVDLLVADRDPFRAPDPDRAAIRR